MTADHLITSQYPILHTTDKVLFALKLMDEYEMQQLPVLQDEQFLGLIDKDDLLDANEKEVLLSLQENILHLSIQPHEHFLFALKLIADLGATVVPIVTNEKELLGIITQKDLLLALNNFLGQDEPGGLIVIEMEKRNYSFGEISRLVETNDAIITQLNSFVDKATGIFTLVLKLNKLEISHIVATLQRYDYNVVYYFGEEIYENELKENYDLLMNYLRM